LFYVPDNKEEIVNTGSETRGSVKVLIFKRVREICENGLFAA